MSGVEWRGLIALLLNEKTRIALAEVVLEEAEREGRRLSALERSKARAALTDAGVLAGAEPAPGVSRDYLQRFLRRPGRADGAGLERFLRSDGRIDRYPANQEQRRLLLAWVAGQVLAPGEVIDERTLSARLGEYSDDPVLLRRYLVDVELVERAPDGSAYFLPEGGTRD
ncbi:DUF2087 domain-containing protein [Arthrobacter cupressi]|uniref:Uncharacterized protein n=1 Tax=Arthrobacter cupressi TaxID=1045773 RepID=A0A1G8IRG5_9MICC|nr:DUF2087 domain-containing protein [Arthrobacter cupressi]NYD79103.1 hypothetical protein [Arthrobacter cupressi]SDI21519.1 hypothetical protein SAMN05216555_101331 [Arthrobacter cupressi]